MEINGQMLKKVFFQVPGLIVLATILALGVNQVRTDGIPLVGDWSAQARIVDDAGDSLTISLEDAKARFAADAVLFLDARSRFEYDRGHIRGALSLPWPGAEEGFVDMADRLPGDKAIITYCDGETCDLSHELALFLKEMGFDNVRVLVNGWSLWRQAGLPTDGGA